MSETEIAERTRRLFLLDGDQQTGPIRINRDCPLADWQGFKIVQIGSSFRIHDQSKDGFAITLCADDALWLIESLKLGASSHQVMRRAVIWAY